MENLTNEQIEKINEIFEKLFLGENEGIETIEDKLEVLEQYYSSAGFDIRTEEDLFKFLNI